MTTEPTTATVPEVLVPFRGRDLVIRLPEPEQLLVWQRIVKRLQDAPITTSWTGVEVMNALEKLRKIFDSILDPADIEWLDERFLDRSVNFQDLSGLLSEALSRHADREAANGNRAERREQIKKVRRKKAGNPA